MHRAYFPSLNIAKKELTLRDLEEIHHIKNVLRLKKGDPITELILASLEK